MHACTDVCICMSACTYVSACNCMSACICSGLVDDAGSCRPCPGGYSCSGGVLTACERYYYYSLPGDLRCRACPLGSECIDPSGPPSACGEGEALLETEKEGQKERRCGPCPEHSYCPSPLLVLPLSEGHQRDTQNAAFQHPLDICHTNATDPKCPQGGICWAGRFFPCPE